MNAQEEEDLADIKIHRHYGREHKVSIMSSESELNHCNMIRTPFVQNACLDALCVISAMISIE